MGSWNGTCMLSNLPITYKTPVRLVLLIDNAMMADFLSGTSSPYYMTGMGDSYSVTRMRPASILLPGVYDDYGGAQIQDLGEVVLAQFKSMFGSTSMPFDLTKWQLSTLKQLLEKTKDSVFSGLGYAMIREDVFNQLSQGASSPREQIEQEAEAFMQSYEAYRIKPEVKKVLDRKTHESGKANFSVAERDIVMTLADPLSPGSALAPEEPWENMLYVTISSHGMQFVKPYATQALVKQDAYLMDAVADTVVLACMLDQLRRPWHLPVGDGQGTYGGLHAKLGRIIMHVGEDQQTYDDE